MVEVVRKIEELLIIAGVFQGIFLVISLSNVKSGNPIVNRVLRTLLISFCFTLSGRLILPMLNLGNLIQWMFFPEIIIYLFGPLLYRYIRAISSVSPKLPWYYYTLVFLQFLVFLVMVNIPHDQYIRLRDAGAFNALFFWYVFLAIISNLAFSILSFYTIKQSLRDGKARNQALIFGRFVLICCTFILVNWLGIFILNKGFNKYNPYWNYGTVWTLIPLFFFYISFYAISNPKLFETTVANTKKLKRVAKGVSQSIEKSLLEAKKQQEFYLNPQLTLNELSKMIDVSPNDLSWYLNNKLNKTFYIYVNELRVEEFMRRINKGEHHSHTLLSIAFASGFNSKSTFNKSFKSIKGVTPSSFVKELELVT